MVKSTYGTGCFLLANTGGRAVELTHKLLTTIAYQFGGKRTFALEGSIFSAGATVQWLRDGLGVLAAAAEAGEIAAMRTRAERVYLVPAFTGLGAPHWDSEARAAIFGLTRGVARKEIVRGGARERRLSDARPLDAMRPADLGRRICLGHPCRRRNERQRLDDAVPRQYFERASRPPRDFRDHRFGRGLSGGLASRSLP